MSSSSSQHLTPQQQAQQHQEESGFFKWRKRFSRSRPRVDVSASAGAVRLLSALSIARATHQRALLKAFTRWRVGVEEQRREEQRKGAMIQRQIREAEREASLGAQGLATLFASPRSQAINTTGGSTASVSSPQEAASSASTVGSASATATAPVSTAASSAPISIPHSHPYPPSLAPLDTTGASSFSRARSPTRHLMGMGMGVGGVDTESVSKEQKEAEQLKAGYEEDDESEAEEGEEEKKKQRSTKGQGAETAGVDSKSPPPPLLRASTTTSVATPASPSHSGLISPRSHNPFMSRRRFSTMVPSSSAGVDGVEEGAAAAAASKRLSMGASPWTSARPQRPSLIQTGRRGTLTLPSAAVLSPSLSFRRARELARVSSSPTDDGPDGADLPAQAAADATSPISRARRDLAPSSLASSLTRGSVLLGDLKEWQEKEDRLKRQASRSQSRAESPVAATAADETKKKEEGDKQAEKIQAAVDSLNAVAADSTPARPSLPRIPSHSAVDRRRTLVLHRWRNAIRQVIALSMWARRRSGLAKAQLQVHQQMNLIQAHAPEEEMELVEPTIHGEEETEAAAAKEATAVAAEEEDGAKASAAAASAAAPASTTGQAAPLASHGAQTQAVARTPKLLDYFLIYGPGESHLSPLKEELLSLSRRGNGLTSREQLEQLCADTNTRLAEANRGSGASPEILMRFPLQDRPAFPVDVHWGLFGFPEGGMQVSLVPRVMTSYSSVMTQADGLSLFATYLKWDQPILPELPNAFCPVDRRSKKKKEEEDDLTRRPHSSVSPAYPSPVSEESSPSSTSSDMTPQSPLEKLRVWDEASQQARNEAADGRPRVQASPAQMFTPSPSPSPSPSDPTALSARTSPTTSSSHSPPLYHPQLYVPYAMVLISHYPQFDVLRCLAHQLFEVACSPNATSTVAGVSLESYLVALCLEIPLPIPRLYAMRFRIHRALCTTTLPGVRAPTQSSLNLTLLFRTLNVDNIIGVLAAILTESRILFHSTSLNLLTYCMQCFLQLLYPFQYWYSFVPQLTEEMLDAHEIPQPYMLGVHSKHLPYLRNLQEVLVVDLDHDALRCNEPLTPLPIREGRELWLTWRRAWERIQIQRMDQVEDCRVKQMEGWARSKHMAAIKQAAGHPLASPLPPSTSSTVYRAHAAGDPGLLHTITMHKHVRKASFIAEAAGGGGGSTTPPLSSTSAASAVAATSAAASNQPATPVLPSPFSPSPTGSSDSSSYPSHPPSSRFRTHTTPIASPFPSSAFNFDEEIYSALLRFYSDLLSGYTKFLFFIQEVPFFNAQGFLQQRMVKEGVDASHPASASSSASSSLLFFQKFVASRAFDVFIEEESTPDPYHEFLATGLPLNRITSLLQEDFCAPNKVITIPDPVKLREARGHARSFSASASDTAAPLNKAATAATLSSKQRWMRVEVETKELTDEVIQAVLLTEENTQPQLPPMQFPSASPAGEKEAEQAAEACFPLTAVPFATPLRPHLLAGPGAMAAMAAAAAATDSTSTDASVPSLAPSPLRLFHWPGLESDLLDYNFSLLQPTPRRPKQLQPDAPAPTDGIEEGEEETDKPSRGTARISISSSTATPAAGAPLSPSTRARSSTLEADSTPSSTARSLTSTPAQGRLARSNSSHSASSSSSSSASGRVDSHRLKMLMSHIFSSQVLSQAEMREFGSLLADATCRRLFSTILCQPKHAPSHHAPTNPSGSSSSLCLTPSGFEQLSALVQTLLDQCMLQQDYASACGALESATIYYFESRGGTQPGKQAQAQAQQQSARNSVSGGGGGTKRVYLESQIQRHPLWQDINFWKANLKLALAQRAARLAKKEKEAAAAAAKEKEKEASRAATGSSHNSSSHSTPSPPPLSPSPSLPPSDSEFILQWMISAAHQMMSNHVPHDSVEGLMKEVCVTHKLQSDAVHTIQSFLQKTREALNYWNQ